MHFQNHFKEPDSTLAGGKEERILVTSGGTFSVLTKQCSAIVDLWKLRSYADHGLIPSKNVLLHQKLE